MEIRVENPKGEDGRIVYDLQGAVIDVVGGAPENADAASDAEAPAQLRPLGMTDATPARVKKFDSLFNSFHTLVEKYVNTRWEKMRASEPDKPPQSVLPREALREKAKVQQALVDCLDRLLKIYAERNPPSDAIASPKAAPHARTREYWERHQKYWDLGRQQSKLLDENWDDWLAGVPKDEAQFKPWHKEAKRLQGEVNAAWKRVEELTPPD
ncbi:MAG: hypothetical protein H0V56_08310, partial [Chthoniobacterales bacterium]|nr:hypothetical protein [Chthoniobacterales bacterium]